MSVPKQDAFLKNTKKPSVEDGDELRHWNYFLAFALLSAVYIQARVLCNSRNGVYAVSLPAFALAVLLGIVLQSLIVDVLCTKSWV